MRLDTLRLTGLAAIVALLAPLAHSATPLSDRRPIDDLAVIRGVTGAASNDTATRATGTNSARRRAPRARNAAGQGQTSPEAAREEVRQRELAFAATMRARDLKAFEAFLSRDTVFFGPNGAERGAATVVQAWAGFFEGPTAPFSWEPDTVEVLAPGDIAFTSGPVRSAQGQRVGTFNSVWRREADGVWRVVLDKGCPPCPCRR